MGPGSARRAADHLLLGPQLADRAPLIDIRLFVRIAPARRPVTFLLFSISVFGAMLLLPLYYQTVRGVSALSAGLAARAGRPRSDAHDADRRATDRPPRSDLDAGRWGCRCVLVGLLPFAFVGAHTSYVLLCSASFVQGLGMGLAMMPTMTAAMQAVPLAAIARTSTAMNIIRQAGASIGTAVLSVILAAEIKSNLGGVARGGSSRRDLGAAAPAGGAEGPDRRSARALVRSDIHLGGPACRFGAHTRADTRDLRRRQPAAAKPGSGEAAATPLVFE